MHLGRLFIENLDMTSDSFTQFRTLKNRKSKNVSKTLPYRAELGSPANSRWRGGRVYRPLCNFLTNWRSEEREAAIESSQR